MPAACSAWVLRYFWLCRDNLAFLLVERVIMRLDQVGESLRVLMLGWEFPPFISGGLGTACYGLTKAMNEIGTEVLFVLPKPVESQYTTHVKLMGPASRRTQVPVAVGEAPPPEWTRADGLEHVQFQTG